MPEPLLFVKAAALASVLAGLIQLLVWWILSAVGGMNQWRIAVAGALGVGIGFVAGAWVLGLGPRWPPVEDRDRFLAVLLPLAVLIECLAALPRVPPWLAWGMRFLLAAASVPILLYATTYLAELAGPGSREWTDRQMAGWLIGTAAALAVVWMASTRLLRTNTGRLLPFALAIAAAGAGVTVMLSGYLTGGELALPLAGAIGGTALASLGMRMLKCNTGAVCVGIVGLFGVLIVGRFFGEMTTLHGGLLLIAPLLVGVPELLPRKASSPWLRSVLAIVVVVVLIALVVMQAHDKFVQASGARTNASEPAADDYLESK